MTTPAASAPSGSLPAPAASAPADVPGAFSSSGWIGRSIDDRYRIESLLGEGGMGAVFLAEHVKLEKKVALKVILPQFAGDGEIAERFAREAMASAKLEHPHVVSALDYGTLPEGGAYLVMQLARGRSLREAMVTRKGDARFAAEVGAQIADALSAAHAARVVHRDLKPENVVLEPKDGGGELVRVLDFGIARVVDDGAAAPRKQLTRVGTIIGTPGYMAPEQALGEAVDERADMYALGVILWEIVAGETLFPEDDVTAIVTRQLTTTPPALSAKVPGVPDELDALVARLLTLKEQRTLRASEVRETLRHVVLQDAIERVSAAPGTSRPVATAPTMLGASISGAHAAARASLPRQSLLREPSSSAIATAPTLTHVFVTSLRALPKELLVILGALSLVLLGVLVAGLVSLAASDAPSAPVVAGAAAPPSVHAPAPAAVRVAEPNAPTPSLDPLALLGLGGPPSLGADFDVVATSEDREDREAAAGRILADPDAPELARLAAELELADGCRERRQHLRGILALGDARALPLVERLDDLPRRGCGFLGSGDCHSCMRRDLRNGLRTLRGETSDAAE